MLLGPESTIATATEVLTNSSMRIVLVADNVGRLLGTVTDGDIRRALIQQKELNTPVSGIMHTNPTTVSINHSKEKLVLDKPDLRYKLLINFISDPTLNSL